MFARILTDDAGRSASEPVKKFVSLSTGVRIEYVEQGDPYGESVVFLHGWPDSWFSFSRLLPLLPHSLRIVAVDQRGFGDSDRPESGYAIPEMGADVIALFDALQIDRATLVGHSFGSFVARQAAIAQPQRIAALALIGTGFAASTAVMRNLQHVLRDLPDPIPLEFAREFQASTLYRPVPTEFFERIVAESLKLPPRLWRLAIDRLVEYDDSHQLANIEAPTLLLWGDHDALFSRADQDRFMATLPAARLSVYEETGHCPNWERPEQVAADIADLIRTAEPAIRKAGRP
jgi:pimeloyl-ACP methyl ester carboxylesterase